MWSFSIPIKVIINRDKTSSVFYRQPRSMNVRNKGLTARRPGGARGRRGWSRLRKLLALAYGLILIGAVSGIGFFVLNGSQPPAAPPQPGPAAVAGAVVALPPPFAAVAVDLPPPEKPEAEKPVKSGGASGMRVAIVIDDMGPDVAEAKQAILLNPNVTLSFLPYARNVRGLAALAHASGHELLLHLPMEPLSHTVNPGPNALLTDLPVPELIRRLDWNLAQFSGYVGINNHMGSHFTSDAADMVPVLQDLKTRGLLFLDSRTTNATVGRRVALQVGIPFAERDVFLDNDLGSKAVGAQLDKVIEIARKHGLAIAIGHPHPMTLKMLAGWIPTLKGQGITLVPLSQVVTKPVAVAKAF